MGLSNILLDIYSEAILPSPPVCSLVGAESAADRPKQPASETSLPSCPLGLGGNLPGATRPTAAVNGLGCSGPKTDESLSPAYKATSLPLGDRLAARDRAYALLSGLTRLGTGWNYTEAWFALARAYEESEQPDKAKEVLWWCVELEEGMGVRPWACLGEV